VAEQEWILREEEGKVYKYCYHCRFFSTATSDLAKTAKTAKMAKTAKIFHITTYNTRWFRLPFPQNLNLLDLSFVKDVRCEIFDFFFISPINHS